MGTVETTSRVGGDPTRLLVSAPDERGPVRNVQRVELLANSVGLGSLVRGEKAGEEFDFDWFLGGMTVNEKEPHEAGARWVKERYGLTYKKTPYGAAIAGTIDAHVLRQVVFSDPKSNQYFRPGDWGVGMERMPEDHRYHARLDQALANNASSSAGADEAEKHAGRDEPRAEPDGQRSGALENLRRAATAGDADAQFSLGLKYAYGEGVAEHKAKAVEWYRKAAEQGHAAAQYNLGVLYANGEGVAQDYAEAIKWTRKAAEQGDENAEANLEILVRQQRSSDQPSPQDHGTSSSPASDKSLAAGTSSDAGAVAGNEPSEQDMLAAVQAKFDQVNANYRALGEKCERREFRNDPLMAMQCLQLCGAGAGTCRMEFKLTRFEKLGCEKAVQQTGYICDFIAGFASDSPFAQGAMNHLTGGGNAGQGRFIRQDAGWLFLPLQRY